MDAIKLENISKKFEEKEILKGVNLGIKKGENFGIFGSSGCGKTTLLRIIAGLETPDEGNIYLRGNEVNSKKSFVQPEERNISFIFQDLALWPHMTVKEHLKFVLDNEKEIGNILESCNLDGHEKSRPEKLSGGEKQKLALARAIAQKADIFLLDEPFSSLDLSTKEEMKDLLKKIQKKYGLTILYVTHDIFEVIDMCERVGLMEKGEIVKVGRPKELLKNQLLRIVNKTRKVRRTK